MRGNTLDRIAARVLAGENQAIDWHTVRQHFYRPTADETMTAFRDWAKSKGLGYYRETEIVGGRTKVVIHLHRAV